MSHFESYLNYSNTSTYIYECPVIGVLRGIFSRIRAPGVWEKKGDCNWGIMRMYSISNQLLHLLKLTYTWK